MRELPEQAISHFTSEEWADFARRRVSHAQEDRMEKHLKSGCGACEETLRMWLQVRDVAGGIERHRAPEAGVRFVKALFGLVSKHGLRDLHLEVSRLAPPAFGTPLRQGVRGSEAGRHHYLFEQGDVLLDVHMEAGCEAGRTSMAGQIMNPTKPDAGFGDRPVTLSSGTLELAKSTTNQFGEFHMEFQAMDDLILVVSQSDESLLVTRLPARGSTNSSPGMSTVSPSENGNATQHHH